MRDQVRVRPPGSHGRDGIGQHVHRLSVSRICNDDMRIVTLTPGF
jgi:hypothetical protein